MTTVDACDANMEVNTGRAGFHLPAAGALGLSLARAAVSDCRNSFKLATTGAHILAKLAIGTTNQGAKCKASEGMRTLISDLGKATAFETRDLMTNAPICDAHTS